MTVSVPNMVQYIAPAEVNGEFSPVEIRILDAVNQKVAAGQNLDDIMNFVFDETRPLFVCDRIGLALIEDDNRRVVSHWGRADYEPMLLAKGFTQDLRGSSLGDLLARGCVRIINDLPGYLGENPDSVSTRLIVKEGVRANMTCPLYVNGRAVGFLFRSARTVNAYDEHAVRLHFALSERLAQAVEKAWQIEQLVTSLHNYFEMLGFVSHELKSPLAMMVMESEMLVSGYYGPLQPEQTDQIRKMAERGNFLLTMIGDYLDLARLETGGVAPTFKTSRFADDILTPILSLLQPEIDRNHVNVELNIADEDLPITCDAGLIGVVLSNLLSNAVKYGEPDGLIRITVTRTPSGIRVAVWNRGPGFPAAEYSKLFRKFSRLQSPELLKRKGTGVGLYSSWRVLQLHGGRIWAHSEPGAWAEFVFEIPQPPVAG